MPDKNADTPEAREAADMGEKPDLGHVQDALKKALEGADTGSDTRAGSLRGGSASGSEIDPDQDRINEALAREGIAARDAATRPAGGPEQVKDAADHAPEEPDDDVEAPTG